MNVLVDTSVWSFALRRDAPPDSKATQALTRSIQRQDILFSTGIILQELLQGFRGPKHRTSIIEYFSELPLIVPNVTDHIDAAVLQTTCHRRGIHVGTIDALLAQLAIAQDLELLTTDYDFVMMARYEPLRILSE